MLTQTYLLYIKELALESRKFDHGMLITFRKLLLSLFSLNEAQQIETISKEEEKAFSQKILWTKLIPWLVKHFMNKRQRAQFSGFERKPIFNPARAKSVMRVGDGSGTDIQAAQWIMTGTNKKKKFCFQKNWSGRRAWVAYSEMLAADERSDRCLRQLE